MTSERQTLLNWRRIALALLLFTGVLAGCSEKPAKFYAIDVSGASWGQEFSLPDLGGKTITQKSFPGKITAIFFGFMYCPDACPTHLAKMGEVKKLMGKDSDQLQVIFITLDPERDTPAQLSKYLESFDPTIIGLRGSLEQTEAIAKNFRVFYKKVMGKQKNTGSPDYTIDHTTFTYIFDGQGRLRLVIPHDLEVEKIANDLKYLSSR
jgi:protein SCO1/2